MLRTLKLRSLISIPVLACAFWIHNCVAGATHGADWVQGEIQYILSCTDSPYDCTRGVMYQANIQASMYNAPVEIVRPLGGPRAYAVTCRSGNKSAGFNGCDWTARAPTHPNCRFKRYGTDMVDAFDWDLGPECNSGWSTTYGPHSGAGPGFECLVVGILQGQGLHTPWGVLSAQQMANSNSPFCMRPKSWPMDKCTMKPLHDFTFTLGTTGNSRQGYVVGVDCKSSFVVRVEGGATFTLGPGVTGTLTFQNMWDRMYVDARLEAENAKPGTYRASKVIVLEPY